ncbi:MAG: hypothetical protein M3N12_00230, partial [Verrucomicrobiota bacterium]|nr:hypothetical protein [Verrucomicrobiota bacterium]
GQVAAEAATSVKGNKKMVWIPKMLGSNIPAHWADADSAEAKAAKTAGAMSIDEVRNRQSQGISPGN